MTNGINKLVIKKVRINNLKGKKFLIFYNNQKYKVYACKEIVCKKNGVVKKMGSCLES